MQPPAGTIQCMHIVHIIVVTFVVDTAPNEAPPFSHSFENVTRLQNEIRDFLCNSVCLH